MKVEEIRQRANRLGIATAARIRKADLIRAIQRAEGNRECFGADWRLGCDQLGCCWRADCLGEKVRRPPLGRSSAPERSVPGR